MICATDSFRLFVVPLFCWSVVESPVEDWRLFSVVVVVFLAGVVVAGVVIVVVVVVVVQER